MNIDWALAGNVVISGVVIVFAILVILIGAVVLMGKIMNRTMKTDAPTPPPPPVAKAPEPQTQPVAINGIADETVAVISAAVSAYMDVASPGVPYAVTGITPQGDHHRGARPSWGYAGMRQNTEPF